jgi:hypothetical protein
MSEHLDLDVLADALAGTAAPEHLARCPACTAALEELRIASDQVASQLSALPPVPIPDDVAIRLTVPHADTGATVTTLPPASSRTQRRWLPAAAAGLVLLAGAGYGASQLGSGSGSGSSTSAGDAGAKRAAPEVDVVRNSSGADYTDRASLASALPSLLSGDAAARDTTLSLPAPAAGASAEANTQMAAADPLARLRDNAGLAECLLALLPPEDPSVRPLAIDYATYKGAPAMVVVLPATVPDKLDVFVVGPECSRANDSTLFYTSVDKP